MVDENILQTFYTCGIFFTFLVLNVWWFWVFFQLNMASILYLGFAVVVALASGVDAQSSRRCSSVSLIIQDNNPFLLPLPLYLFLTSFLVFFLKFPRDTCPVGYNCVNGYCEGTRQLLNTQSKAINIIQWLFSESKIINVVFFLFQNRPRHSPAEWVRFWFFITYRLIQIVVCLRLMLNCCFPVWLRMSQRLRMYPRPVCETWVGKRESLTKSC